MTVRVRFAPSPTGSLHIGSVRTTLYNYFFARQKRSEHGALILRIEDTDQDRLVAGAVDSIYDGLGWMGVSWDEGPREGGPHSPYIQSERLPRYQQAAQQLVASGAAYLCFCSKERLAALRAQQAANKQMTRYDRHCRNITPSEAAERAKTEPHVVRLKVPEDGRTAATAEFLLRLKDVVLTPELRAELSGEWRRLDQQYPNPPATLENYVAHVMHGIAVAGIDHVGIGCDFDGGGGVAGLNEVSDFPDLSQTLLDRGLAEADLAKLWGGNTLRVLRACEQIAG